MNQVPVFSIITGGSPGKKLDEDIRILYIILRVAAEYGSGFAGGISIQISMVTVLA